MAQVEEFFRKPYGLNRLAIASLALSDNPGRGTYRVEATRGQARLLRMASVLEAGQ